MSKNSRNSGKFNQGNVMSQFYKDARASETGSAVMQCKGKLKEQKQDKPRFSMNHICR